MWEIGIDADRLKYSNLKALIHAGVKKDGLHEGHQAGRHLATSGAHSLYCAQCFARNCDQRGFHLEDVSRTMPGWHLLADLTAVHSVVHKTCTQFCSCCKHRSSIPVGNFRGCNSKVM